jgi:hypothetical protein
LLFARCVWINDNKDKRKILDTSAHEGQNERRIEKKGRKNEKCTK